MITTTTLNAAIDKTYYVKQFKLGASHRATEVFAEAGGKGINVARTLLELGADPYAMGFLGGNNGSFIQDELDKQGIKHDFIRVSGESRINLNIIDESDYSSTEVLESGPVISVDELEQFRTKIAAQSKRTPWMVCSGSLPRGVALSTYAELIEIARNNGTKVFLDTSGEALRSSIQAKPFFIKPNEKEIAELTGQSVADEDGLFANIHALMNQGIACVTVSLGEKGSITGYQGRLYRATVPRLEIVNTVGCGDAFVAGMVVGFSQLKSIEECIRLATATGSANALTQSAGYVQMEEVERIKKIVNIEEIQWTSSK
ncbi:1-phosphofructokinase [Paenibacillus psychroresistens]|uniref:Tagatose-6-phosphate kinase n=1 Tax=Paenibacillus psychroresistens TaxID=1778678 RepID=A0A6B8RNJ9_9BACL|nr:1-phosphofructokinase [Paenibacillus psychroresistens]QGQ97135.1 1-phosphofructokinase [Paenibacillus psychroresistens]